jgi:predicted peptidase
LGPKLARYSTLVATWLLLLAGCGGSAGVGRGTHPSAGLSVAQHIARPFGTTRAPLGFWEYLPVGYGDAPRPLLIFWHGVGENGGGDLADLQKVPKNGPPQLIQAKLWPETRPFVVLSPQHAGVATCPTAVEVHDFITFALASYEIDRRRVYLTGLSCGAKGSADYLATYGDEQVAAAVLVAGDASPILQTRGCGLLTGVGLWVFHGDADATVAIAGDDAAMSRLGACTSPHRDLRYTVYPGVGHDSWSRTYDMSAGHDIYTWMLNFGH